MHSGNKVVSDGESVAESEEMCNLTDEFEEMTASRGTKRKLLNCDFDDIYIPPKRMSPFLNTPKEKKEEKRKVLKTSIKKLKEIDNAELCLRRSVLIQNTVRRLQRELREDKLASSRQWRDRIKPKRNGCPCSFSTCYLKNPLLYDDPVITDANDKISDDMTDTLMKNLEEKIGGRLACISSIENNVPRISLTPVPFDKTHDEPGQINKEPKNVATRSVKSTGGAEECFNSTEDHFISICMSTKNNYSDSEKPLISSVIDNHIIDYDRPSLQNLSHECSPFRIDVKADRTTHDFNSIPPLSNSNLVSNSGNHNVLDVTLRDEIPSFSEKPLPAFHDNAKEDNIQRALKLNPVLVSG